MRLAMLLACTISLGAMTGTADVREASPLRCSMALLPGKIVGVIEDTTPRVLRPPPEPYSSPGGQAASLWRDSLLATPTTLMPTAWVRATHFDAATRAQLVRLGFTDPTLRVIVQALPYRMDCRTMRWTNPAPWVVASATPHYFSSVALLTRDHWHDGLPTFTVAGGTTTPYPRWIRGPLDTLTRYTDRSTGLVLPVWRDTWPGAIAVFTRDTTARR